MIRKTFCTNQLQFPAEIPSITSQFLPREKGIVLMLSPAVAKKSGLHRAILRTTGRCCLYS